MLVKFGRNYINPAQVVRVVEHYDDSNEQYTVVYTSIANQYVTVTDKTTEQVVALINANL
jgi:hypothetical protein